MSWVIFRRVGTSPLHSDYSSPIGLQDIPHQIDRVAQRSIIDKVGLYLDEDYWGKFLVVYPQNQAKVQETWRLIQNRWRTWKSDGTDGSVYLEKSDGSHEYWTYRSQVVGKLPDLRSKLCSLARQGGGWVLVIVSEDSIRVVKAGLEEYSHVRNSLQKALGRRAADQALGKIVPSSGLEEWQGDVPKSLAGIIRSTTEIPNYVTDFYWEAKKDHRNTAVLFDRGSVELPEALQTESNDRVDEWLLGQGMALKAHIHLPADAELQVGLDTIENRMAYEKFGFKVIIVKSENAIPSSALPVVIVDAVRSGKQIFLAPVTRYESLKIITVDRVLEDLGTLFSA